MIFVQEFHWSAKLPKAMTTSFIALVPKNYNAWKMKYFRPIFPIGCMYKLVSKILESRLKKVIGKTVLVSQKTIVSGR